MRFLRPFDRRRRHACPVRPRRDRSRRRRAAHGPGPLEGRVLLAPWIDNLGPIAPPQGAFANDVRQDVVSINSAGEVAATGHSSSGGASEAYVLDENGRKAWLPPPAGGAGGTAAAVNAAGDVAGYSTKLVSTGGVSLPSNEAALYDGQGRPSDLGNLGGPGQATGLNDLGQVVGDSATGPTEGSPVHAFLYDKGGPLIDLGTLGGPDSYAAAINDAGQIVGDSTTGAAANGPTHAFLLTGRGPLSAADDLGVPPGYTSSYATAINDKGQVAGYSSTAVNADIFVDPDHVFLYTGAGGMRDLNALIGAGAGWTLEDATAINDDGMIAGAAAAPTPASSTGACSNSPRPLQHQRPLRPRRPRPLQHQRLLRHRSQHQRPRRSRSPRRYRAPRPSARSAGRSARGRPSRRGPGR